MHHEHQREMHKKREELPKHIVKQKYFDEPTPNLLTWSEKEQIRFLHTRDPETWTPQKISESFPVTESAAKVGFLIFFLEDYLKLCTNYIYIFRNFSK